MTDFNTLWENEKAQIRKRPEVLFYFIALALLVGQATPLPFTLTATAIAIAAANTSRLKVLLKAARNLWQRAL